jgi:preprotein translocase subunit SecE
MARDRQSAKRRQAQRREERLRAQAERSRQRSQGTDGAGDQASDRSARPGPDGGDGRLTDRELERAGVDPAAAEELDPVTRAQLATGAPPEDVGRSDTVVESPPPAPELGAEDRERQPRREPEAAGRGRVISFLVAVWAELQRVQWPDRKAVTTLTGVVLGFVLICAAYFFALEAILQPFFSKVLGGGP